MRAEVEKVVSVGTKHPGDGLLQLEAGMICADGQSHCGCVHVPRRAKSRPDFALPASSRSRPSASRGGGRGEDSAMTPTDVAEEVVTELARTVAAADAGRRVALAVPGGSVAELLFPRLARLALDWSRIDVTWVDERVVPPDHPDSNVGVARRHWLDQLAAPGPRIITPSFSMDAHPMAADWQGGPVRRLG